MSERIGRRSIRVSLSLVSVTTLWTVTMGVAGANNPVPEGPTTLQDIARMSAPEWNFARANRNDPCWPEDPFDGNGNPKPGGDVKNWPDSDGGCAKGGNFPTFYTVRKCNANEIRASFSIYQATSGFRPSGHSHDFEHIDVIWNKQGNEWTRSQLWGSAHGGHHKYNWNDAESWNADRSSAGKGREFPRIFVGFGSHAMFNNQAGLKDVASAYTDNEYRHADYRSWSNQGGGLVEVQPGGNLYNKFKNANAWGGTTTPAHLADKMCGDGHAGR